MKIIYLHQYFRLPCQSGGTRSYDLAKSFVDKGIMVEVISSTNNKEFEKGKRWKLIEYDGIKVHYVYVDYSNDFSYLKRILSFLKFFVLSSFKIITIKCDYVLATSTPLTIGIPALINKWIRKVPFVFEVRDVWPEAPIAIGAINNKLIKKILFWLEGIIYKNAFAIVPLSVDMYKSIAARYPEYVNTKNIKVIENISEVYRFQNGYDDTKFLIKEKIGDSPRFIILYAGTFGKVNGIDYVIDLAEKTIIKDSSIAYVLIGNGADKVKVRDIAFQKKLLNKNVFILDAVAKEDLPQLYFESNMGSSFVIDVKELWANSANKYFDTLAAGRPILINYKGWQKDDIEKNNIGYVLPPILNDESINDFVEYTKNDLLYIDQSKNALFLATKEYSLNVAVKKYLEVFMNRVVD